ncbi:MAG: type II toxin-antitoxin system VapC family toxin [Nitrospirae bacterium]|nr:type II toxin-antitoxin system VapC family toxin [Nitrospirota bacterium]
MRFILDTHAFLWFIMGSPNLSSQAKVLIEGQDNNKLLSIASVWEMAIKVSLGRLIISEPFSIFIPKQLQLNGINLLNLDLSHAIKVEALPFYHRDPFDRIIAAQSIIEDIPIISIDEIFEKYSVKRFW